MPERPHSETPRQGTSSTRCVRQSFSP